MEIQHRWFTKKKVKRLVLGVLWATAIAASVYLYLSAPSIAQPLVVVFITAPIMATLGHSGILDKLLNYFDKWWNSLPDNGKGGQIIKK